MRSRNAALAECQVLRAALFDEPYAESPVLARAAAERALELDGDIAEAHAILGAIRTYYDLDWTGAEAAFKRALELGANSSLVLNWYGDLLVYTGRFDEAIAATRRANELDPISPLVLRGSIAPSNWSASTRSSTPCASRCCTASA